MGSMLGLVTTYFVESNVITGAFVASMPDIQCKVVLEVDPERQPRASSGSRGTTWEFCSLKGPSTQKTIFWILVMAVVVVQGWGQ